MNNKLDTQYMKIIKYAALCFAILLIIYRVIMDYNAAYQDIKGIIAWIVRLLKPLIIGGIIAYLFFPIVKAFERMLDKIRIKPAKRKKKGKGLSLKYVKRGIAVFLTFLTIIIVLTGFVYGTYVMIGGSIENFNARNVQINWEQRIKQYLSTLTNVNDYLKDNGIIGSFFEQVNVLLDSAVSILQNWLTGLVILVPNIGKAVLNLVFGTIFAVSFIIRREYFSRLFENFLILILSERKKAGVQNVLHEINKIFHSFFRSQLLDLTLISIVTTIALLLAGSDFAILVGLVAGYTNIIPYIGSWAGALPGFIVGLAQGGLGWGIFIYFYILIIQQIYYFTISPRIQGDNIGVNPVFILLALSVFGSLFGLWGMILAIPLAGITQFFILKWADRRKVKKGLVLMEEEK